MQTFIRLSAALLLTLSVGLIGYLFTEPQISTWYTSLGKPLFTPPPQLFAPAWAIVYILLALALVRVWNKTEGDVCRRWMWTFGIQILLNLLWPVLFFYYHALLLAGIDIIFLWIWVLVLSLDSWEIERFTFWLLTPYLAWITFAMILSVAIWWVN